MVAAVRLRARARAACCRPGDRPQRRGRSARSSDTILLKTERMRGVRSTCSAPDRAGRGGRPVARGRRGRGTARTGAARRHLAGRRRGRLHARRRPELLGRKYGLAANNVHAIELVTADGRLVRADRDHEPELFWALRGGGGSFGVVTAIELELFPLAEAYAASSGGRSSGTARCCTPGAELTRRRLPDELTTMGRYLRLPPIPEIPEPVGAGRS